MNRLALCILLSVLLNLTTATENHAHGRRPLEIEAQQSEERTNETDANSALQTILKTKSKKQRTAYGIQLQHLLKNQTINHLLVKLKGTETLDDDENASFFDPFFQWLDDRKKDKYEKIKELKKAGFDKMQQKLDEWGVLGILQEFFGLETGISILRIDTDTLDMKAAWLLALADPDVEIVDVDMPVDLFDAPCNLRSDWGYQHTRAERAAKILGFKEDDGPIDEQVLVAVIDSGVDYRHPLLKDRIWINTAELNGETGVDDDGNGYVDDIYGWNFASNNNDVMDTDGHGTHVAGIIAGHSSTRPRFSGVAPNALILPCRFTDEKRASISAAIQCIEYAIEAGAQIISNSWGGTGAYSLTLEEAMLHADSKGILQVTAAGNSAENNDGPPQKATFPASFKTESIIAVAAIDNSGSLTSISNYGQNSTDIAAPGFSIVSTHVDGRLVRMSGTSQAAPFVTAASALLMGACRHKGTTCTAKDIKQALIDGAEPSEALDGLVYSAGYLDIPAAAKKLKLVGKGSPNEIDSDDEEELCSSAMSLHAPFISIILSCVCVISSLVAVF